MMNDEQNKTLDGKCLCGAVTVQAEVGNLNFDACHCGMCRKWSGGSPFLAVENLKNFRFDGESNISVYNSSDWAERGFCKQCGTPLFYRLKEGEFHALPVGLFSSDDDWKFSQQIFIDEKPGFYNFANHTKNLTGEELFAQFQQQPDE